MIKYNLRGIPWTSAAKIKDFAEISSGPHEFSFENVLVASLQFQKWAD